MDYVGPTGEWKTGITLDTYGDEGQGSSKFDTLSRNYSFIKHMMAALEVAPGDYLIVRDLNDVSKITVRFNASGAINAPLAAIMWGKYATAKMESQLT